jgi:hypothetical protein
MLNTIRNFTAAVVALGMCSSLAIAQIGARAGNRPALNPPTGNAVAGQRNNPAANRTSGEAPQRLGGRRGSGEKPTGSQLSEQQQQNLQKLQSDLQAIKQGSQVTPEQKQALKNDLLAMADGATKPDPALVQQLANDLSAALADGNVSNAEKAKLTKDLDAVMDSASIPAAEVQQAISDAQAILTASGVDKADVQTIVKDLQAIANEAKKNAQAAGSTVKGKLQGRLKS